MFTTAGDTFLTSGAKLCCCISAIGEVIVSVPRRCRWADCRDRRVFGPDEGRERECRAESETERRGAALAQPGLAARYLL